MMKFETKDEQIQYLKNTIFAMIDNVQHMSIGVGLPNYFVVMKDGKIYAQPPDSAQPFYKAVAEKWKKDHKELIQDRQNQVHNAELRARKYIEYSIKDNCEKRIHEAQLNMVEWHTIKDIPEYGWYLCWFKPGNYQHRDRFQILQYIPSRQEFNSSRQPTLWSKIPIPTKEMKLQLQWV